MSEQVQFGLCLQKVDWREADIVTDCIMLEVQAIKQCSRWASCSCCITITVKCTLRHSMDFIQWTLTYKGWIDCCNQSLNCAERFIGPEKPPVVMG